MQKVLRWLGFICVVVVVVFFFKVVVDKWLFFLQEWVFWQEIKFMEENYKELQEELGQFCIVFNGVQECDVYVYCMVFGMDFIDEGVWEGGVGGYDKYENFCQFFIGDFMVEVFQDVDMLKCQFDFQFCFFDIIFNMVKEKEKMFVVIFFIKFVCFDKLVCKVGLFFGFGWCIYLIYKIFKMYYGIDFIVLKGILIQVIGVGKVIKVGWGIGYGNWVIIDYGYGY